MRAVHAKEILLEGSFTASPEAATLSQASIFSGKSLPMVARFSDFTGIPNIPDTIGAANPRGFAFKIKAEDGDEVDVVSHSFNGFPVATSDEFPVFLRDIGASGAGVAHPNPIERFLESHPIAKTFVSTQKPPPASYATTAFFGVNAFTYTNAAGKAVHVRYRLVPQAGELYLTADELATKGPNHLLEEISQRVAAQPVGYDWYVQIAEDGDKIDDPSIAWPDQRELVKLGSITITKIVADQAAADKATLFLPGQPHAGIDPADPMLMLRDEAYPISFQERQ